MTQITLPTASNKSHQWEAYPFNFMKSPLLSDSLFYLVLSGPWKQIISIVKCVITLEKANTPQRKTVIDFLRPRFPFSHKELKTYSYCGIFKTWPPNSLTLFSSRSEVLNIVYVPNKSNWAICLNWLKLWIYVMWILLNYKKWVSVSPPFESGLCACLTYRYSRSNAVGDFWAQALKTGSCFHFLSSRILGTRHHPIPWVSSLYTVVKRGTEVLSGPQPLLQSQQTASINLPVLWGSHLGSDPLAPVEPP